MRIGACGWKATWICFLAILSACGRDPSTGPRPGTSQFDSSVFGITGDRLARLDTDGNQIDAHGGEIVRFGNLYYWYGEQYGCGAQWTIAGTPFCGFRVYTSPDLVHWTSVREMWPASTNSTWQSWCGGSSAGCFRPRVIYNALTQRYVLWFNSYQAVGGYWVMSWSSPTGDFEILPSKPQLALGDRPYLGDEDVFLDDDGNGYIAYTNFQVGGDIVVERLAANFLTGSGAYVRAGLQNVEAPSLFKRAGTYYLTFSDPRCGFCSGTGTSYVMAASPLGPWSAKRQLSTNSCGGQPSHVSALPGANGDTTYLYQSDLWINGEFNQATAYYFWTPLHFNADGSIQPVTCPPPAATITGPPNEAAPPRVVPTVPPRSMPPDTTTPQPDVPTWRLVCDIASGTQRELQFSVSAASHLDSLSMNVFQRGATNSPEGGSPNAPLVIQLRSVSPDSVLSTVTFDASTIWWSARKLRVPLPASLVPQTTYTIRLSTTATKGCYGVLWRTSTAASPPVSSFVSRDAGASWTLESYRTVKVDLSLGQP